jgi:HEAT repeat protein
LREWAEKAGSLQGTAKYLNELLSTGELSRVQALASRDPDTMKALLLLFVDPDTGLNTRIGISAVMELLEGTAVLQSIAEDLRTLLAHADARVRGDACYYLALGGHPNFRDWVRPLLDDPDEHVREIALDALGENAP